MFRRRVTIAGNAKTFNVYPKMWAAAFRRLFVTVALDFNFINLFNASIPRVWQRSILTTMKHLAFYYAIGFAVVGCVTLICLAPAFTQIVMNNFEVYAAVALILAMFVPFVITVLSWRDWRETHKRQKLTQGE